MNIEAEKPEVSINEEALPEIPFAIVESESERIKKQVNKNPFEYLLNFAGQIGSTTAGIANNTIQTVANAAGSTGQMAGLLFAGELERGEIPDYEFSELASRFEEWLRDKKRGEVTAFYWQDGGEVFYQIRLKESGFLAGEYLFIFAGTASEMLTNPLKNLEFDGIKFNGIALLVEDWPESRYNLEKALSCFVWRAGVKLGNDGPAPDYVSSWLIDLTGNQFEKRELIEEISEDSRRFSKDLTFTSRVKELALMGRVLLSTNPTRAGLPWIFSLTSEGGAGKSYFLNRVQQAYGIRLLQAKLDHVHYREAKGDLIALLAIMAEKFKLEGCPTPTFDKNYRLHIQFQEEVEEVKKPSGPEVARQVGKIAGGAATKKVATHLGKTFKKLGFIKHLPNIVGVSASLIEIGFSLYGQLPQDQQVEIDLLLGSRPVQDLTNALVLDLANFVREQRRKYYFWRRPTIVFDTYEESGPLLDQWLRSILLANPLFLDLTPFIFIAGRYELLAFDSRWSEYQSATQTIRLKAFNREEAEAYLEKLGVDDRNRIDQLFELTGGLPLFLHLAANLPDEALTIKILAERVLEEIEPRWWDGFLEMAGPESFNLATIKRINNLRPQAELLFEQLLKSSFVSFKGTYWQFQPSVRQILLKYRIQRNYEG